MESEGEDGLSEVVQEVLHHSTYHVHITHLSQREGGRERERGREGERERVGRRMYVCKVYSSVHVGCECN